MQVTGKQFITNLENFKELKRHKMWIMSQILEHGTHIIIYLAVLKATASVNSIPMTAQFS
jgi:hypothetical protein